METDKEAMLIQLVCDELEQHVVVVRTVHVSRGFTGGVRSTRGLIGAHGRGEEARARELGVVSDAEGARGLREVSEVTGDETRVRCGNDEHRRTGQNLCKQSCNKRLASSTTKATSIECGTLVLEIQEAVEVDVENNEAVEADNVVVNDGNDGVEEENDVVVVDDDVVEAIVNDGVKQAEAAEAVYDGTKRRVEAVVDVEVVYGAKRCREIVEAVTNDDGVVVVVDDDEAEVTQLEAAVRADVTVKGAEWYDQMHSWTASMTKRALRIKSYPATNCVPLYNTKKGCMNDTAHTRMSKKYGPSISTCPPPKPWTVNL